MRGRGGGAERILYERITGNVIGQAIQINLNYKKTKTTNASATPIFRDIVIRDVQVSSNGSVILCNGLKDSAIQNLSVTNVTVDGAGSAAAQDCDYCNGSQLDASPKLCITPSSPHQGVEPPATATVVPPIVKLQALQQPTPPGQHLKWLGFYGCDPRTQRGWTSLCISENRSLFDAAARPAKMAGLARVTWAFFMNAVPPRKGLMLQPNYLNTWRSLYWGTDDAGGIGSGAGASEGAGAGAGATAGGERKTGGRSAGKIGSVRLELGGKTEGEAEGAKRLEHACGGSPCLRDLKAAGSVFGVFLGDELLAEGINVTELSIAAETVKHDWPEAIVYWNEAWDPVVNNDTYPQQASALHAVPDAIDWISLDFYRQDATAWSTPEEAYTTSVYPKMKPHQRALQVPQAFGRTNDVCGAHCYTNHSEQGCCTKNHRYLPGHGGSGQANHTFAWWDNFTAMVATRYYEWAVRDPMIVGINPWYYGADRPDATCGGNNISVSHLPAALATWKEIGRQILAGSPAA